MYTPASSPPVYTPPAAAPFLYTASRSSPSFLSFLGLDRVDLDLPKFLDTAAGRVLDFVKEDNARALELERIRTARAFGTAQLTATTSPGGGGSGLNLAQIAPWLIGGVVLLVLVKAAGGR